MSKRVVKEKSKQALANRSGSYAESKWLDVPLSDLKKILEKTKDGALNDDDRIKLGGAVDTLAVLTQELEAKGASISRLRKLIFGPGSEKTRDVLGDSKNSEPSGDTKNASEETEEKTAADNEVKETNESDSEGDAAADRESSQDKPKRKGHGRNPASDYTGAEKITVSHETLKPGDRCPECIDGKVYAQKDPAVLVRVKGMAPLLAIVYEMERLRCNLCGEVFTAPVPQGLSEEKYDETAAAMIALLKYGCGMPFNRLERLQEDLGIPLPASTQWEVVEPAAMALAPAYAELIQQAAQGQVLHNDDTTAKILELVGNGEIKDTNGKKERTGTYTSGIVSVGNGQQIALFFTGNKHAGENLETVLKYRSIDLGPPIQMSDALSANTAGDFTTIVSNCNAHARRRFVEVVEAFPPEVRFVLEIYKEVYINDDMAKQKNMSPASRLAYHREFSGPLMDELEVWGKKQIDDHLTEPNSSLGRAILYMQKHWKGLTRFLHSEGAPLDNNLCERVLKKAILHRKNAMFFKTQNGAAVADLYMSLIHTCELARINPFDYIVALLKHRELLEETPENWMPWNYRETLATVT